MTSPAAYNAHVLADGPLLYWPMDEPSGTVVTDLSGGGFHGTYIGAPLLGQPGPLACADPTDLAPVLAEVPGAGNGQMAYRSTSPFSGSGAFTWEHWIRPNDGTALLPFVLTMQQRAYPLTDASLVRLTAHTGVQRGQFGFTEIVTWADYPDRLGCWTHSALRRSSAGNVVLFVNGEVVDTGASGISVTNQNLSVGADWVDVFPNYISDAEKEQLRGQVAKVAIFNYEVPQARLRERAAMGCMGCGEEWVIGAGPMGATIVSGWQ